MTFQEKIDLALNLNKISMAEAVALSKQYDEEMKAIKEARKYAKPRNGYSRVTKRLQWN